MKVTNPEAYLVGWLLGTVCLLLGFLAWPFRHRVWALRWMVRLERWLNP